MNRNQLMVFVFMSQIPSQAKTIPKVPSIPSLEVRILRARLMLEEVFETIQKGLGLEMTSYLEGIGQEVIEYSDIEFRENKSVKPNMIEIADGLADQEVVNQGTAIACGLNHQPFFDIVMRNNMKKLATGTIDEFGKLVKPKDHVGPEKEIAREIEAQCKEKSEESEA